MLSRWPSRQDCKKDTVGELIASLCIKYRVSDLRQHTKGQDNYGCRNLNFPLWTMGLQRGWDSAARSEWRKSRR